MTEKFAEYFNRLPFWDFLTEAEKELIRNNAYIRHFDKSPYILCSGEEEDIGIMLLLSGKIRAFIMSPDGREISLFTLERPDLCVFSALSLFKQITFHTFLSAESRCKAFIINMSVLNQLMKNNPAFKCFAYEIIAERFSLAMESVQRILFYGLEQRLAIFLVSEYERRGDAHINITHDSIAQYIGTSRERVTKTLKKMCDKNIIRKTKGCIEIINVENLCEIAESPPPENSGGRTTFGLIPFGGA